MMAGAPESYFADHAERMSTRDALQAVLAYANDFISRGDIDVMFTLSGGQINQDGYSADPAVWGDWVAAWRTAFEGAETSVEPGANDHPLVDAQHGFRALHVFLEQGYQPVDTTPMSRVRDDCLTALSEARESDGVWKRWLTAITAGETADISFQLSES
jgi:hypothetical protein